mgnify:FL=1
MHGLINRSIQCFIRDAYGVSAWQDVVRDADLPVSEFEAMLHYDDGLTEKILMGCAKVLARDVEDVLEDLGTHLVSHPTTEPLRRLLRFGGFDFVDFLHSLDELPDRARLAVADLEMPMLSVRDCGGGAYTLQIRGAIPGFGAVFVGILRAMADDYGALAVIERRALGDRFDALDVRLLDAGFADGRSFDLARGA